MNYREKMREYLKEPNGICNHYGKWGILNKEQRDLITRLLNEMDGADNYIKKTLKENARLKDKIEKVIEYVNHYESIKGYYEYEECGYDEYNYEEDLKEELLEILKEN